MMNDPEFIERLIKNGCIDIGGNIKNYEIINGKRIIKDMEIYEFSVIPKWMCEKE